MIKNSNGLPCGLWIGVLVLLQSATLRAGDAHQTENIDALDEVRVIAQKPSKKPSEIFTWMRRLVGQFTYEGDVDLGGTRELGKLLPVQGHSNCVPFGPVPAVQCEITVTWPVTKGANGEEILGGISPLDPATILYGFEPDEVGVRFMLVDSRGFAEPALGMLVGNTLTARAPCVNVPGNCQKTTRITAEPDGKLIEMRVDFERDYKVAVSYRFVLRRVSASAAVGGKLPQ